MLALRRAATILAYAFVPILLVLGSFALSLTEATAPATIPIVLSTTPSKSPSATQSVTHFPTVSAAGSQVSPGAPIATASRTAAPTATASRTPTAAPTKTAVPPTNSQAASPTTSASATTTVQPPLLTMATPVCGPFPGWIPAYVVRRGDTLFRIALRFGTTILDLQQGNCKSTSVVYAGERLWVPGPAAFRWGSSADRHYRQPWEDWSQPVPPPYLQNAPRYP